MADFVKDVVGVFKGFAESELEFKAEIVVPYHTEFTPLLGSFLLVSVTPEDYLLGRITKFYPVGIMSGGEAEDYLARLMKAGRSVPEDVKEAKLRYNVNVKLLGGLTADAKGKPEYRASIRRLPHLGAFVGIPNEDTLQFICSLGTKPGEKPALLGHLALGDVVFDGNGNDSHVISFDVRRLVGRRTYVFAHAGYGKSNLVKHLVTQLYATNPGVGFLIFDPEAEYAFADQLGRPGLADVPELQDKLVVFTDRRGVPDRYKRFMAGDVHLDLSVFHPGAVIRNCVVPEKWENVWANAVRGLEDHEWADLVGELETNGYRTEAERISEIVTTKERTAPQSILNNLVPVIRKLHRSNSRMLQGILWHLEHGHIVIVDISLLSSTHGRWVSSLILSEIFQRNQANFISGTREQMLSVVAVIEEAQTVLSTKREEGETTFIEWAKEGRKYALGGIFITQQPGSIPTELVSQGDNFFVFHLLSADDLFSLKRANAHFSNDVLTTLLNEPIPGNAYFWSAPHQPFVLPLRVVNFEQYAKERMAKQKGKPQKTAAEAFAESITDLESELDRVVLGTLTQDKRVPVFDNLLYADAPLADEVAAKLWNVKFSAAGELSPDAARIYSEEMPDGKRVLPDRLLFESLERLKINHRVLHAGGQPYIVFPIGGLENIKKPKTEVIKFEET